jgi:hypothetical protein
MPLNTIDYSKTIFYKIVCNDLRIKECYVGHTTDFKSRKRLHKSKCTVEGNPKYHLKLYAFIRDNGGWMNWSMVPIETKKCESVYDALKRERELIEENQAQLNGHIPSRTYTEWKQDNSEKIKEQKHLWYESKKHTEDFINATKQYTIENANRIAESKKNYYLKNKEAITEYKKSYYIQHIQEKKDYDKEYRFQNAENIKARRIEKVDCPKCGKTLTRNSLHKHLKTQHPGM